MIFGHDRWLFESVFDFCEFDEKILLEAKAIGYHNHLDRSDRKYVSLLMALKLGDNLKVLKRREGKKSRYRFYKLKDSFEEDGWRYLSAFINGEILQVEAYMKLRDLFKKYYREAFELGYLSSGIADYVELEDRDYRWVDSSLKQELKYLRQFLDDIEGGRGRMDYRRRWRMYVDTLDHVFWAGKVSVIPAGFVIDWVVDHKAERCEGCKFLKMHSPYTVETLPTTPRAGMTICLSNCKCKLRVRRPKSLQEYKVARSRNKRALLAKLEHMKRGNRYGQGRGERV